MPDDLSPPTQSLRSKFSYEGVPAIGAFSSVPDPAAAEALASSGLDFLFVDTEHGLATMDSLVSLLPAAARAGTPSLVRVPWNDPAQIMRALDLGAAGVVVPTVSTAEEAAHAVSACRYPPLGIRSFGQTQGVRYGDTNATNQEILCIVMIETAEGVKNADAIASTPGVDGIFIGPIDLALSLGLAVDFTLSHPVLTAALADILAAGRRHGCPVGFPLFGMPMAESVVAAGYRFIIVGSDAGYIRSGAAADLAALRSFSSGDQA